MHEPAVVVDVARLVTYHPWYLVPLGELDQGRGQRCFLSARVMELHFDRESVAEDIAPLAERALSSLEIAVTETRCDRPGRRTGQHLQTFTSLS